MPNTKQRILEASIQLFNEHGIANVRLQQIATATGISTGNLAYHFRNKEAIIKTVHENLYDEAAEILSTYRTLPNFLDLDHQLSKFFVFIQQNPFYFLDLLDMERHYPSIRSHREAHITKMIHQIRKRFDYNYHRGTIIKEPHDGIYDCISETIWVLITFWSAQNLVRRKDLNVQAHQFKQMIWNQMYPYFTPKGKEEFQLLIQPLLTPHS